MTALWRLQRLSRIVFALLMIMVVTIPAKVNADSSQLSSNIIGKVEKISFDTDGKLINWDLKTGQAASSPTSPTLAGVFSGVAADDAYAYIVDHKFYSGAPDVGLRIVDF